MTSAAFKNWKDFRVKIDNASAAITEITAYTNQSAIQGAQEVLEYSPFGSTGRRYDPGIGGATFNLNGWINSTTEGIFGPICGTRTSITKTIGVFDGIKWKNAEVWPTGVQISGNVPALSVWSADFTVDNLVTRTSVAPA
jgi:hypothetical protein